jgi:8-oxo-dGTP diphosphatase
MLKHLLGALWRGAPRSFRLWGVRLVQPRFAVTVGAIIVDDRGRVLLLKHVFRPGSGWGIPGGFINKRENPEDALHRELMEEVGLELAETKLAFTRTLKSPDHVEIIFMCRALGEPRSRSMEVAEFGWFPLDALPADFSKDQRWLIRRAIEAAPPERLLNFSPPN